MRRISNRRDRATAGAAGDVEGAMSGTPVLYCRICNTLRTVEGWNERGEALVIALGPCGHEIRRRAGVEWSLDQAAA